MPRIPRMPRMPRTMQTGIDIVDRVRLAKCLSSKDKIVAKKESFQQFGQKYKSPLSLPIDITA